VSKTNAYETALHELIFQNDASAALLAAIGDDGLSGSTTDDFFYISLHTSTPGEGGSQDSNEVDVAGYGEYSRQAIARSTGGWTVSGDTCSNAADTTWTQMATGTGNVIVTHFGVGTNPSGAGQLLHVGTVTPNMVINVGITPRFPAGDLDITED